MRRLKLYYLFFHSTLKINVPLSILGALIVSKADWSLFWEAFPYLLGGWGIVVSLLYKEFFEKEAYFFYYNSGICLLYTSPSPRDRQKSRMPSSA